MGKKKLRFGLLFRVVIAIAAGIGLGLCLPTWAVRVFATFNSVFSNFLGFMIPLIIVGLVTPAIASTGTRAGKLLLATVAVAYGDTIVSGLLSLATSMGVFPHLINANASIASPEQAQAIKPYFTIEIPAMFDVMSALIFSFVMGLGIAKFAAGGGLKSAFETFGKIIEWSIERVIIPLLPLYICGIFMLMAHDGQAWSVMRVFLSIIGVIFVMHIGLLLVQYCIAGAIARRNPLRLLWKMLPAYFTALGTSSSAATIPVTLRQARANGISEGVAGFVVPLCATIHLSGSAMKITACAVALMLMQGVPVEPLTMIGFILLLGVMMVAAPGVPGGAIMAAIGALQSVLGFDTHQQALMIALYIAMDSFGTACNVTGDGAIAVVMERFYGEKKEADN